MIDLRIPEQKEIETASRWQRLWSLFRFELLYLSWAVMEVALIAPVALALLPWLRYWSGASMTLFLLLLVLLPFNLVRLSDHLNVPYERQRQLMLIGFLLLSIIATRYLFYPPISFLEWIDIVYANFTTSRNSFWARDTVLFGTIGFCWWRGIMLVTREPSVIRLTPQLRWGLLYLAPLAVWLATVRLDWTIAPFLLLFVLAGLTAVSLTRVEEAEQEQQAYMAVATPQWLSAILLSSLLVIGLAATFAFTLSGLQFNGLGWLAVFAQPLRFAGNVISLTFLYLTVPIWRPIERFLNWLVTWWNEVWTRLLAEVPQNGDLGGPVGPERTLEAIERYEADASNLRWVGIAIVFSIIVFMLWYIGRRYRQQRLAANLGQVTRTQRQQTAVRDNAPSFFDQLRQQWDKFRNRGTIRTIRRIYAQMSRAAAISGYPRDEAQTAYEYLPSVIQVWPEHSADVRLITEAYVKIRYGTLPETKEEFEAILAAWRRLEETEPQSRVNSE